MYEPRTYRHWTKDKDLISFRVVIKETDLYISALTDLSKKAYRLVLKYRDALERYIRGHSIFLTSLEPIPIEENAPQIVKEMARASAKVGVGPMAAVAGAIAEFVGQELLAFSPEIIVENGGDIFLRSTKKRLVGIYAGKSPLSGKIGLEINGEDTPLGVCTSSGTVGHSLICGRTDATVVLAKSTLLADAAATAIGNLVVEPGDIPKGIEFAQSVDGLKGVVIIVGERMGLWGEIRLVPTSI